MSFVLVNLRHRVQVYVPDTAVSSRDQGLSVSRELDVDNLPAFREETLPVLALDRGEVDEVALVRVVYESLSVHGPAHLRVGNLRTYQSFTVC